MPGYTARTQELGFKPKSVELQSPHIFSKKKQEVVLSNNKGPQVKSSGALSPLRGGGGGQQSRRSSNGMSTPGPGQLALQKGWGPESDPHTVAVQTATKAIGDGFGHPAPVGGAQTGPALRPCGPKWGVLGH